MPAVSSAYFGAPTPFDALDPIELVTLYGCLARAAERFTAERIRWDATKERKEAYQALAAETTMIEWMAIDTLAVMLGGVAHEGHYGYNTREISHLAIT